MNSKDIIISSVILTHETEEQKTRLLRIVKLLGSNTAWIDTDKPITVKMIEIDNSLLTDTHVTAEVLQYVQTMESGVFIYCGNYEHSGENDNDIRTLVFVHNDSIKDGSA